MLPVSDLLSFFLLFVIGSHYSENLHNYVWILLEMTFCLLVIMIEEWHKIERSENEIERLTILVLTAIRLRVLRKLHFLVFLSFDLHQRVDIPACAKSAQRPSAEKTGKGSLLNCRPCPPDDPIGQGTDWTTLVQKNRFYAISSSGTVTNESHEFLLLLLFCFLRRGKLTWWWQTDCLEWSDYSK